VNSQTEITNEQNRAIECGGSSQRIGCGGVGLEGGAKTNQSGSDASSPPPESVLDEEHGNRKHAAECGETAQPVCSGEVRRPDGGDLNGNVRISGERQGDAGCALGTGNAELQGGLVAVNPEQPCETVVQRWRGRVRWKLRRVVLSFELQPDRVQSLLELNRKINKIGALVYGPFAFTFGVLLASQSKSKFIWLGIVPTVWFVGMIFSHIVFKRCVLNELVRRMSKFKVRAVRRLSDYKRPIRRLPRVKETAPTGALTTRIYDETDIHSYQPR
jgi:hypothetical protein